MKLNADQTVLKKKTRDRENITEMIQNETQRKKKKRGIVHQ